LNLKLQKFDGRKKEITSFTSIQEGKNALFRITESYNLCQKFTSLYITTKECFQYKIKECDGACIGAITPEEYNARVQLFIDKNTFENQNMVLIDRGRTISERSAVLIENGNYKGYCFYDLNYQINNLEILKNIIVPMENNRDVKNIIQGYIRKTKSLKIIKF
jgi:DNA polymerase-3 subunit epsilon